MAEDSVTSSEEHDGVERSEEEEEDVDLDTLPGWTGWMSTKKVIRSRFFGRAFKSKSRSKEEKEKVKLAPNCKLEEFALTMKPFTIGEADGEEI